MNRPMHTADSKAVDTRAKSIARSSEAIQHDMHAEQDKAAPMQGQSLEARLLRHLLSRLGELPLRVVLPTGEEFAVGNESPWR